MLGLGGKAAYAARVGITGCSVRDTDGDCATRIIARPGVVSGIHVGLTSCTPLALMIVRADCSSQRVAEVMTMPLVVSVAAISNGHHCALLGEIQPKPSVSCPFRVIVLFLNAYQ